MSFKRDGDDLSLLNRLKHQRVTDLLSNYIPDEEAKLLSNGRVTCLVCMQRPIFDTINMLSNHRKGKKHLSELSKYIKRKSQLELEAIKKEQKDSLPLSNNEDSSPALSLASSFLLGSKEHFSGKFKRKIGDNVRRKTLEIPNFINETETMKTDIEVDLEVVHSPSSASQVRHYLKQLPRKMSLERSVEMKKENCDTFTPKKKKSVSEECLSPNKSIKQTKKKSSGSEFSLNMCGWIKDKFGNWIKDPNAEFDTDEDEPPSLPT